MSRSKHAPPDPVSGDAPPALAERAALQHSFARVIGHELRNRVNAARLSFSVVRLSDDDRRPESLEALDDSLEQLEEAVSFISSIAVAQARVLAAATLPLPLADVLAQLRADLEELALQPRVELRIATAGPEVAVDAVKLRLALVNLVATAVQRADRGKALRWVEIRVGSFNEQGECRIDVEDNGVGLSGMERVSGADSTAAAPLARPELGMVLAQEAIAGLGGRLWVESDRPGLGSIVSFTVRSSLSPLPPSGNS